MRPFLQAILRAGDAACSPTANRRGPGNQPHLLHLSFIQSLSSACMRITLYCNGHKHGVISRCCRLNARKSLRCPVYAYATLQRTPNRKCTLRSSESKPSSPAHPFCTAMVHSHFSTLSNETPFTVPPPSDARTLRLKPSLFALRSSAASLFSGSDAFGSRKRNYFRRLATAFNSISRG